MLGVNCAIRENSSFRWYCRRCCSLLCGLWLLSVSLPVWGQGTDTLRVMFYNVENLFDCQDDSLKDDSEYLPNGMKGWNPRRYRAKLAAVSRVIAAVGGHRFPDLVGLCEVENEQVLTDLVNRSSLRVAGYHFMMTSSPDERGVDVALLYLPGSFRPLNNRSIPVIGGPRPTRDILHVCGLLPTSDTLDVIVCHLPSRFGGTRASRPFRRLAAYELRQTVDSILALRSVPRLLVMGDFNDELTRRSEVAKILNLRPCDEWRLSSDDTSLFRLLNPDDGGSYAYKGRWELIDNLLVSGAFLKDNDTSAVHLPLGRSGVGRFPFLLQLDDKYGGYIPYRTHLGGRYLGGYSDHLPVMTDVVLKYLYP